MFYPTVCIDYIQYMLQLLSHPFIKRYLKADVDLASYVKSVVDPTERLKQIAEVSLVTYFNFILTVV